MPSTVSRTSKGPPKLAIIQAHAEHQQTDLTQARCRVEHPHPLPTRTIPLPAFTHLVPSGKVILEYGLSWPTWTPSTVVSTAIKVQGGTKWWLYSLSRWVGLLAQLVTFLSLCLQALGIGYCGGLRWQMALGGGRKIPESDQTGRQGMHLWVLFTRRVSYR